MTARVLTRRQEQIVRLRILGATIPAICTTLGISRHTCSRHLDSVYHRIGARCVADLTLWSVCHAVLSTPELTERLAAMEATAAQEEECL